MTTVTPTMAPLTASQRETLAQVFADALSWRGPGPASACADCMREAPGTRCPDHEADGGLFDAYLGLADSLGIEVPA